MFSCEFRDVKEFIIDGIIGMDVERSGLFFKIVFIYVIEYFFNLGRISLL